VAIIDAAAPDSVTYPRRERSEYLRTIPDEPPSYASLTPGTNTTTGTLNTNVSGKQPTIHSFFGWLIHYFSSSKTTNVACIETTVHNIDNFHFVNKFIFAMPRKIFLTFVASYSLALATFLWSFVTQNNI